MWSNLDISTFFLGCGNYAKNFASQPESDKLDVILINRKHERSPAARNRLTEELRQGIYRYNKFL